ncbi:hypothetical protein ENBRE01_0133 [Enteropsectra breve]|nr:hypothetical protein ENBRE01_0133 [Enteropsectra breve]
MWAWKPYLALHFFLLLCGGTNVHDRPLQDNDVEMADCEPLKFELSTRYINGMKVNVLRDPKFTHTYVSATTNLGMQDTPAESLGLANFLGDQIMRTHPAGMKNSIFELIQKPVNSDVRCSTTNDRTQCSFISDNQSFTKLLEAFAHHICNFVFPAEELAIRKRLFDHKLTSTQSLINSKMLLEVLLPSLAKYGTSLQRRFMGSEKTLAYLHHANPVKFKKMFYNRENTTITVVTPLNSEEVYSAIEYHFKGMPNTRTALESVYVLESEPQKTKFQIIDAFTHNDNLRDEFKNKLVLFRGYEKVVTKMSPRVMFVAIPLPGIYNIEHKGFYSIFESVGMKESHAVILNILRRFNFASDFSMGIDMSAKSASLLWIELSLPQDEYTSPSAIVFLFKTIFEHVKKACFKNTQALLTSCCRHVYTEFYSDISNLSSRKSNLQQSVAEVQNACSKIGNFIEATDVDKIMQNISCIRNNKTMENSIAKGFVDLALEYLCDSRKWIVMLSSSKPNLKLCNHLGQRLYLDVQEKASLNGTLEKELRNTVNIYYKCHYKPSINAISIHSSEILMKKNIFSVEQTAKNAREYLERISGVHSEDKETTVVVSCDKGKYALSVEEDTVRLDISINSCEVLNFSRSDLYKGVPEIMIEITWDAFQNERDILGTIFAIFIAYRRFEIEHSHTICSGNLRASLSIDLNRAKISLQTAESYISSYCQKLQNELNSYSAEKYTPFSSEELAYAKQYFINIISKEMYSASKLENLISSLDNSSKTFFRKELEIVNCIINMNTKNIYVHAGVRLLMKSRNVSFLTEIMGLYDANVKNFKLQTTGPNKNKTKMNLALLAAERRCLVQYLNTPLVYVVRIIPFKADQILAASYFERHFYEIFHNKFLRKNIFGNIGFMRVSFNDDESGGFILIGIQGPTDPNILQFAIERFLINCNDMACNSDRLVSLLALDTNISLEDVNYACFSLREFFAALLDRKDHSYIVSVPCW